jgi:superfamily II DNA or RNA helicase
MIADEKRNEFIFNDILEALKNKRSPLLLTERTQHLEYWENKLKNHVKNILVLKGGIGKKQRHNIYQKIASIPPHEERLIIATGRYVGEGFDDARLDTLFLTTPISWHGTLQQYIGRLHREYDNKHDVIVYDYVDKQIPMIERMFNKRLKKYQALGYEIE